METNNNKGARVSLNSVGSLFSDSWALYAEHFSALTEIVLLPVLTIVLGYALIFLGFPFSIIGILIVIVGYIAFVFASIALILSINGHIGVDAAYRASTKFFWPVVWMSILGALAVFGGTVMLIIPGIWLAVALTFKGFTVVLENRRGIDSLRQSKEYTKGYWWAIVGRTILFLIAIGIIAIVVHIIFSFASAKLAAILVSLILATFVTPFGVVFYYKIYENLRTLKPELHGAQHSGGGFIKVAAIVGLVVGVVLAIVLVSVGVHEAKSGGWSTMGAHYDLQYQYPTSNQ